MAVAAVEKPRRRKARTEEERRIALEERADRNRKAAQASRDRKRKLIEDLETTVTSSQFHNKHLSKENEHLTKKIKLLETENANFRTLLTNLEARVESLISGNRTTASELNPLKIDDQQDQVSHHPARMLASDPQCLTLVPLASNLPISPAFLMYQVTIMFHFWTTTLASQLYQMFVWTNWQSTLISPLLVRLLRQHTSKQMKSKRQFKCSSLLKMVFLATKTLFPQTNLSTLQSMARLTVCSTTSRYLAMTSSAKQKEVLLCKFGQNHLKGSG